MVRSVFTALAFLTLAIAISPAKADVPGGGDDELPLVKHQVVYPAENDTVDAKGFGAGGFYPLGTTNPRILIVDKNAKVLVDEPVGVLPGGLWIWYGSVPATDPAFIQVYEKCGGVSASVKVTIK
jgi:hypothetical protein